MESIRRIYENGVFRPTTPVNLPEGTEVSIDTVPIADDSGPSPHLMRIYELAASPKTRAIRASQSGTISTSHEPGISLFWCDVHFQAAGFQTLF